MDIKLKIQNFKCLRNVEIELKPLVFLFGPNGGGKSSLLKALKFLNTNLFQQDVLSSTTIFDVENKSDNITYEDVVFNNDINTEILFEFAFSQTALPKDTKVPNSEPLQFAYYNFNKEDYWFEKEIRPEIVNKRNYYDCDNELDISIQFVFSSNNEGKSHLNSYCIIDNLSGSEILIVRDQGYNTQRNNNEADILSRVMDLNFPDIDALLEGSEKSMLLNNYSVDFKIKGTPNSSLIELLAEFEPLNESNHPFRYVKNRDEMSIKSIVDFNRFYEHLFKLQENSAWASASAEERRFATRYYLSKLELLNKVVPLVLFDTLYGDFLSPIRETPKRLFQYDKKEGRYFKGEYYGMPNEFRSVVYRLKKLGGEIPKNHLKIAKENPQLFLSTVLDEYYAREGAEGYDVMNKHLGNYFDDLNKNYIVLMFWLRRLSLAKSIYIKKEDDYFGSMQVQAINGAWFNLADASSGLLQILPILYKLVSWKNSNLEDLQDLYYCGVLNDFWSKLKSIFAIEQPELHLHPKLQADLIPIILEVSDRLVILETHSEHMVRKLQILVAKGQVRKEKVKIYYIENKKGSSQIKEMELDEKGLFIENWPDGFFDDSVNLTLELYEALRIRGREN